MVTPSDEVYCYHYNAIGCTVAMTDGSQEVVNKYAYSPFGIITNQQETVPQPFKYVGQHGVMTEPNGLQYMRARYYDPSVGRFISEDPIGFGGGDVNFYAYASNNPVLFIDPWGLCPTSDQPTQASLNPFPNLPSFSEAFPESHFIAPVADIIVGALEAGVSVATGVTATITFVAGPEFWWLTVPTVPMAIESGWDAYSRIKTGIQRLGG